MLCFHFNLLQESLISSLIHCLFIWVWFNFHMFIKFPVILLFLASYHCEKIYLMILLPNTKDQCWPCEKPVNSRDKCSCMENEFIWVARQWRIWLKCSHHILQGPRFKGPLVPSGESFTSCEARLQVSLFPYVCIPSQFLSVSVIYIYKERKKGRKRVS